MAFAPNVDFNFLLSFQVVDMREPLPSAYAIECTGNVYYTVVRDFVRIHGYMTAIHNSMKIYNFFKKSKSILLPIKVQTYISYIATMHFKW